MSRGRGRGRGGSNAVRDSFNAAFAGLSKEDSRALFESFSKPVKGAGMLYPPLEKFSELPGPTEFESLVVKHTNELLRDMAEGPRRGGGRRGGAPWRLASERKVVGVEIESYSDRYRKQTGASSSGPSQLDAQALHLNADLLPPQLYGDYFDPQAAAERKKAAGKKRRRVIDSDDDEPKDKKEESDDGEDEEIDFDFDDDEEDDHQDYDANYFDNGEGDDDSGGEGEDERGGYDD